MTIGEKILDVALEFEGLVEVISNAEWDDLKTPGKDARAAAFEAMLKRVGHEDGWAYCMSFCEGSWVTAYEELSAPPVVLKRVRGLLSPSVMASFNACREAGLISTVPRPGAIGFMQSGSGGTGHAFLVQAPEGPWVHTIEGNTSPSNPDERDGGIGTGGIWRKRRSLAIVPRAASLHLRGFLNPLALA